MVIENHSLRADVLMHMAIFNQGEDFFLRLGREFQVPSFSIHHDINNPKPEGAYLQTLRAVVDDLQKLIPDVFDGLTYFFDPAEILRPGFFQLYRVNGVYYLYILRIDLVFRPQTHVVIEKGSNDVTPVYRTSNLIIEASIVPLKDIQREGDAPRSFFIDQMISDTWIGETGRGYFVQGIWMDTDLSKFFTRLFIPEGKRIYPYYPFTSKYRTVCHVPVHLGADHRRSAVPMLHKVRGFLHPYIDEIQSVLREEQFSPDLPLFQEIRNKVPPDWMGYFEHFSLDVYLNEQEMREFEVVEAMEHQ